MLASTMPKAKGPAQTTYNVRLPLELLELARRAAAAEGFDTADLVRRAVRRECERVLGREALSQKPKPRR